MLLTLIAAADENNVIGKGNTLPWHLPNDMKRFRTLTEGAPVIMGRKTFASIGKPLPKRDNIVISRNPSLSIPGCTVVESLEEAIGRVTISGEEQAFVIGGGEIYEQALPHADRIELTRVHTRVEDGDAFFPKLNLEEWQEIAAERHGADKEHAFSYTFLTYERRQ